jgi:hypothetical protein
MAARITTSCHSNGLARLRTQSCQYSRVASRNFVAIASGLSSTAASGPIRNTSGSSISKYRSLVIALNEALVVSRNDQVGA